MGPLLVGGWTTQLKNMLVKMGSSSPNFRDEHIKIFENHHLENNLTLPETNMAHENWWLEYYFPFGKGYFQGLC